MRRAVVAVVASFLVTSCPQYTPMADCHDNDGDGYTAGPGCGGDCDDNNPDIHPGALEVCNGIDDNCNGLIDEPNTPGGVSPCCEDKVCGAFAFDGGSCGQCAANALCNDKGQCVCIATCRGRQCGDDGCGGSCGSCPVPELCTNGFCNCTPSCKTGPLACGDDGCGGSCGACVSGQCVGGLCSGCTPNCTDRACGDDSCGGMCGTCQAGQRCDLGGVCVSYGITNTESWRQATFNLPSPRTNHMQADFVSKQMLVVFGGSSDTTTYDDTVVLDYSNPSPTFAPSPANANPPTALTAAVFGYTAPDGPIVLAGGWDPNSNYVYADTWTFDGSAWTLASSVFDYRLNAASAGSLAQPMVYGGISIDVFGAAIYDDDRWSYDGQNWNGSSSQPPGKRYGAAMSNYSSRGYVLLFGGKDQNYNALGDTWTFDTTAHTWQQAVTATQPPARAGAVLAEDRYNDVLVLYGGFGQGSVPLSDTWIWDGRIWTQVPNPTPGTTAPSARGNSGFCTARLTASDSTTEPALVLTGGQATASGTAGMSDVWIWGP